MLTAARRQLGAEVYVFTNIPTPTAHDRWPMGALAGFWGGLHGGSERLDRCQRLAGSVTCPHALTERAVRLAHDDITHWSIAVAQREGETDLLRKRFRYPQPGQGEWIWALGDGTWLKSDEESLFRWSLPIRG
ncbi:MAG: hypothetical protein JW940_33035 [Polyangiaceae bacterium]|nr:hypothetical protein [Polyangiaceae bacterium]